MWQNGVQIVLSLALAAVMGFQGALLGFTLAYVFGALMAMGRLARQAGGMGPVVGRAIGRYVIAAAFMAPMTWGMAQVIGSGALWHTTLQLIVAGTAGGAVYVVVLWILGSDDLVLLGLLAAAGPRPRPRPARTSGRPPTSEPRSGARVPRRRALMGEDVPTRGRVGEPRGATRHTRRRRGRTSR